MIDMNKQELQVPVINPVPARVWEFKKRLHIKRKIEGFGALVATMPPMV